jgi:redox-sensing transcriptional repressor
LLGFFRKTLDQDEVTEVALIGVGNLGTAFLNYNFLKNNNIRIQMGFDADPAKVGTRISDVPIYHIDQLEERMKEIEVAILTIPAEEADTVTERLVNLGITGILNFTPARITVPSHIRVHHIDLAVELQALVYFLKHYPLKKDTVND